MKEKAIGKIIGGLLICLMLGLVFGGLIDATCATTEKTTISVTESSPWFTKGSISGSGPWYPHTYEGHSYISTYVGGMSGNPSQPDCWAEFKPYLSQSGKYEVYAYFYACKDTSTKVPFTVKYDGGSTTIKVNQYRSSPAWKEKYLGTWNFAAGSSTYVKVTDATGETYNGITGLSVGTIKFVKVQTTSVPSPPTLISPGSSSEPGQEIDTLTPTFNWNSVFNADYYGLYISKYPYGSSNIVFEKEGIYGTSFTLPSGKLQDGVKYRWNMRAHNSAGWSGFSSKLYFTVDIPQPPSPPTLISPGSSSEPGQEINTLTPTFNWNSVSNADYYGLYVSKHPYGSSNIVFEKEGLYGTSSTLPSGKLQDGVKYRWNMRAHNSADWSGFSSKLYFTVNIPQPPSPPTLISPGSSSEPGQEINTLTPTFNWNSVSNVDYYGLYVSKYPYGSGNIVFEKEGLYGTSFTLPSGKLQDGVKYRWNMRAHNSAGWSGFSSKLYFKVNIPQPPSPPTLVSPGSSSEPGQEINTLTPTFNWNSVSNADYYGLYVSKHPYGSSNIVFEKEGLYGTSSTLPSGKLQDGVKYRWNMRAHNSADWSGFSSKLYFTVNILNSPPNTPSKPSGQSSGYAGTAYSYSTSATDPDGDQVKYTFDWGDSTTSETSFVNSGTSASKSHSWSSAGTYSVKAKATDSKGASSGWSSSKTVTITQLNNLPNTPSRPSGPSSGYTGTAYSYSTSATDPDGDQVKYTFDWGDGTTSETSFVNSGTSASKSHSWSSAGTYSVKAKAADSKGASSGWSSSKTVTIAKVNNQPNTPSRPSGPSSGYTGTSYGYSTSATDPDGDQVKYTFDWGDGTTSETNFVNSGTSASKSHSWSSAETYYVKAKATDSKGASSGWSSSKTVTIAKVNNQPNTPSRPSGPSSGYTGTSYGYSTSATDPDGDQVKYTFDWGDGQQTATGFYNSGATATASHSWSNEGTYYVKVKAMDSKGASSGWSNPKTVTIERQNHKPSAYIDSISPNPAKQGQTVSFNGRGTDPDGDSIAGWNWRSSINGFLSSSKSFSKSDLSVGTHTIYFKVKDSHGLWSDEATKSLTIKEPSTISIKIDEWSAEPQEVKLGEKVTLKFKFTNTGDIPWTFYAALSLRRPDNTVDNSPSLKAVTLSPTQQGSAEWTYTMDMQGKWDVVFGVWEESSQQNSLGNTGWLNDYIRGVSTSVPCFDGQRCYSTKEEAVSHVPTHVVPTDCFVWKDGPPGYPWRVIPGTGCAHWVAHQLGIRRGATCYAGYSIRVSDVIYGRTEVEINSCKVSDIWTNSDRTHCGIVRQLGNGKVLVEHDSSVQGGVVKSWFSLGKCWTLQPNQPPTCAIELRRQGTTTTINKIGVGEFFDIYVGDSTDDQDIKEVRFSSDDSQDGNPTGTWKGWYDWDTSLGDWNAISKTKAWKFTTEGSKEVWAEVKDGDGQTDKAYTNIIANPEIPTPVISGFDPSRPIACSGKQWITIIGNGFVSDSEVSLSVGLDTYLIPEGRTWFINSNKIEVLVGLTKGTWKVWITNPDDIQSNKYTFQVSDFSIEDGKKVAALALPFWKDEENVTTMVAIAAAESCWNPNVGGDYGISNFNCGGYASWGLWQIYMDVHKDKLKKLGAPIDNPCETAKWLSDPNNNVNAAYEVWKVPGFKAWSTYNNGKYKAYLDYARDAVKSLAYYVHPIIPVDSDGDGLTDEEELKYGTNPNKQDSDDDGFSDKLEVDLALEYKPILALSDGELFYPTKVENFLNHSRLMKKPDKRMEGPPVSPESLEIYSTTEYYLDLAFGPDSDATDLDHAIGLWEEMLHANVTYTSVSKVNIPYICMGKADQYELISVQYWFFYIYNYHPQFPDHEGDWEHITVYLDNRSMKPVVVTYNRHHLSPELVKWNDLKRKVGNHPIVFVANGSHASYPDCGQMIVGGGYKSEKQILDSHWGEGPWINIQNLNVIMLQTQPWIYFKGKWGENSPWSPDGLMPTKYFRDPALELQEAGWHLSR